MLEEQDVEVDAERVDDEDAEAEPFLFNGDSDGLVCIEVLLVNGDEVDDEAVGEELVRALVVLVVALVPQHDGDEVDELQGGHLDGVYLAVLYLNKVVAVVVLELQLGLVVEQLRDDVGLVEDAQTQNVRVRHEELSVLADG